MENIDDDIYILSGHDILDGSICDTGTTQLAGDFVISRSAGSRPDPAVQALQQAYSDLKKRFNETVQKNQHMSRALRDVGRLRNPGADMATYSDPVDSFNPGAAATGEAGSSDQENQRMKDGHIRFLERERVSNEARLQQLTSIKNSYEENCKSMQIKLRETVKDLQRKDEDLQHAHATIRELKEENIQIKEDRDLFRKHAKDLQEHMQTGIMQSSVERENRELEELKVKCSNLERQYVHLKEECDRLQVSEGIAQSELQTTNKKLLEMQQSNMSLADKCRHLEEELQIVRDSDLPSGSSLPTAQELVHLKKVIADLKGTVVQQREFLSKIGTNPGFVPNRTDPGFGSQKRLANEDFGMGMSWENIQSTAVQGGVVQGGVVQGGVVCVKDGRETSPRRTAGGEVVVHPSNSWNSSLRRSTSAANGATPRDPVLGQEHSQSEVLRRRPTDEVPNSPRSKSEVLVRATDAPGGNIRESSPRGELPWQQQTLNNIGHMNGGTAQYQSTYDNTNSRRRTPQTLAADNFTPIDNTPAFPVPLQLEPNTRHHPSLELSRAVTQESHVNGDSGGSTEKVCPVCSRDFSAMPMEDFQTHVFECFDDQSAPETLRASVSTERICPMCNALYPAAIAQEEFEKHVQEHFEQEIIDRFEILNP